VSKRVGEFDYANNRKRGRMNSDIIAIIPARGGSKSVPRKNIRLLCGKPLIVYTIEAALSSKYIKRVIVSTEDEEIAEIAKECGAAVTVRPSELAQDDTPSLPVFKHVIKHLEEVDGFSPELIVVLQPTSPLRTVEDIDGAIQKFLETDCDSVVSVCEVDHPPHWMYTLEGNRLKPLIEDGEKITRRQDAPKVYRINGAIYVTYRDVIMKQNRVLGHDTRPYVMPPVKSVDIDTALDFKFAELLMRETGNKLNENYKDS
jgi:CMP-N-acetylneuraminic acid synthetase